MQLTMGFERDKKLLLFSHFNGNVSTYTESSGCGCFEAGHTPSMCVAFILLPFNQTEQGYTAFKDGAQSPTLYAVGGTEISLIMVALGENSFYAAGAAAILQVTTETN